MENGTTTQGAYGFLEAPKMEQYFADLNIKLLSGRHIQSDEYHLYHLLEDYFEELKTYYAQLYKLELVRDGVFDSSYFYLQFFPGTKGKLGDPARYKELSSLQTVLGLMLIDMYYQKFFDEPKLVRWTDIRTEIEEGDKKHAFQTFLFGTARNGFTDKEWSETERKFRSTIQSFHELGWVEKLSGQGEELLIELKPALHRLAKLYAHELTNFDTFLHQAKAFSQP